ncbi:MAG: bifunctional glutamate N-acetyltransferase/amino-acid acetyltransferase ArgJ [Pseudomonadales bacterium]|nr:bifunctional glutamate N-acetyltransferase/amino-acid acetyltransferase ArgJ [Pseudomonadales bacterium]
MAVGKQMTGMLHPVPGIRMATVMAGIKKPGRRDLVLFELPEAAAVAGLYTSNAFCAAPVTLAKKHAAAGDTRYFLVNTGNANAGTGEHGVQAALACCQALAQAAGVDSRQVLPFSTGVIGQALPVDKIVAVLPQALTALTADAWLEAAEGIMTTDTRPKAISRQLQQGDKSVTITGIAKGAGMIKPNMATMLAYVFTDARVEQAYLQALLKQAADRSFNRITVDGDTSTNDCCMLVATGHSGVAVGTGGNDFDRAFDAALTEVFVGLAQGLIKDAEGASKFVNIRVEQGSNSAECLRVAYAVAESPLVKTALFASDPNWGRILAAVGRAGIADLDIRPVSIWLGPVCIVTAGAVAPSYTEAQGAAVMAQDEIEIVIRLGRGECMEQVWTSDLSYDYVKINAEYRT